jgi:hypothetical protein
VNGAPIEGDAFSTGARLQQAEAGHRLNFEAADFRDGDAGFGDGVGFQGSTEFESRAASCDGAAIFRPLRRWDYFHLPAVARNRRSSWRSREPQARSNRESYEKCRGESRSPDFG